MQNCPNIVANGHSGGWVEGWWEASGIQGLRPSSGRVASHQPSHPLPLQVEAATVGQGLTRPDHTIFRFRVLASQPSLQVFEKFPLNRIVGHEFSE